MITDRFHAEVLRIGADNATCALERFLEMPPAIQHDVVRSFLKSQYLAVEKSLGRIFHGMDGIDDENWSNSEDARRLGRLVDSHELLRACTQFRFGLGVTDRFRDYGEELSKRYAPAGAVKVALDRVVGAVSLYGALSEVGFNRRRLKVNVPEAIFQLGMAYSEILTADIKCAPQVLGVLKTIKTYVYQSAD